jgi:hypothetical protein
MLYDSPLWNQLMITIGEATVFFVIGLFLFAIVLVLIVFYSIEKRRFYFPRLLKSGLVLMEGLVKAICKLFGLDDKELVTFFIKLHNAMNNASFRNIPVEKRAIFLPQCLRSSRCPAHLTPEGIKCRRCGQCEICDSIKKLEKMGYKVFIIPGSTFIKRMVKEYNPEGIIGVGCLMEVKEGLELTDRMGIVGMGVVTLKDGCVETLVNWNDVLEVAGIGINDSIPKNFDVSSD